jgi:hypothetical protein
MKPCKHCGGSKTWHKFDYNSFTHADHKFEMDNLLWIENQLKKKEREEKHKKLNFCLICKQDKKSPFGICKECSERLIGEKT